MTLGSFHFTAHPPARRAAFDSLQSGVDLTFGDHHIRADETGILRFPDPITPLIEKLRPFAAVGSLSTSDLSRPSGVWEVDPDLVPTGSDQTFPAESPVPRDAGDCSDQGSCRNGNDSEPPGNIAQVFMTTAASDPQASQINCTPEETARVTEAITNPTAAELQLFNSCLLKDREDLAKERRDLDLARKQHEE